MSMRCARGERIGGRANLAKSSTHPDKKPDPVVDVRDIGAGVFVQNVVALADCIVERRGQHLVEPLGVLGRGRHPGRL